ncbi:MAG: nucleoside phosphorylase, partial [Pseudomonadota bacterium]
IIQPPPHGKWGKVGPLLVLMSTDRDMEYHSRDQGLARDQAQSMIMSRISRANGEGHSFALAGPVVGAPYAVMILETLIAWGAREVFYLGWCGSVSPDLRVGDVLVPNSGFIDEGTSPHYLMTDDEASQARLLENDVGPLSHPSETVAMRLAGALEQSGTGVTRGPVWTTDAPFRETPAKIGRFAGQGALAVDMETSALFTVARYRQVSMAAALLVSDELFTGRWNPGFRSPDFREARKIARLALGSLCRNSPQPKS